MITVFGRYPTGHCEHWFYPEAAVQGNVEVQVQQAVITAPFAKNPG